MLRETMLGTALLVGAAAAAGAGGYYYASRPRPVLLDAQQCPAVPVGTALVFVDLTDAWPAVEQERIAKGVVALAERLQKHERLVLYGIGAQANDAPWRQFRRCKPSNTGHINPLIENERSERATYEREFLTPLKAMLPDLVKGRTAAQSAILESLEAVVGWSPDFGAEVPARSIDIFSDLVQHSPAVSHLKTRLPTVCRFLESEPGRRLKAARWAGVSVRLHYLRNGRDAARQGPQHLRWWSELFYRLGASTVFDGAAPLPNETPACVVPPPPQRTASPHDRPQRKR